MGAIVKSGTDRLVLGGTVVSGIIFLACVSIMLSDYKPMLGSNVSAGKSYNHELYVGMVKGYNDLKVQMLEMPKHFYGASPANATASPSGFLKSGIEDLMLIGQSMLQIK